MARSRRSGDAASLWKQRFDALTSGVVAQLISRLALGIVLLAAVVIGLRRLEAWVLPAPSQLPGDSSGDLRIAWADVPDWMRLPENGFIFDQLVRCTGVEPSDTLTDPMISTRVGQALSRPEVGWVRNVRRVEKQFPARLVVYCDYREPVAWVHYGPHQFLVDREGVRLPGRYASDAGSTSSLLDIAGVSAAPPPVGEEWGGDDVHAALAVVRLVDHQPFSAQVTGISVENYGLRQRRDRPHIELVTDVAGSRVWWGRAPGEEDSTEISADQKIELLTSMYQRWGRIDMNRNYVDITTWSDKVAAPAAAEPEPSEPTIRG